MRLLERFEHQKAAAEFLDFRPTLFFGVPTIYVRLLDIPADAAREIGGFMRLFVSGSAPLPAQVFEEFRAQFGHAILERYGMSENLMNISNPYVGERRPGTVGLPLPGVSVKLVDGEIHLKGPNLFAGYWRRERPRALLATAGSPPAISPKFRADGYYTLCGRKSDLIISGGFNIYPREIEEFLQEQEEVAEAAVVGAPDPVKGEVPVAYVVCGRAKRRSGGALPRATGVVQGPARVPRGREAAAECDGQGPEAPATETLAPLPPRPQQTESRFGDARRRPPPRSRAAALQPAIAHHTARQPPLCLRERKAGRHALQAQLRRETEQRQHGNTPDAILHQRYRPIPDRRPKRPGSANLPGAALPRGQEQGDVRDAGRRVARDHHVPLVQLEPRETPPQQTLIERVAFGEQHVPADFRIGDSMVALELDPPHAVWLAAHAVSPSPESNFATNSSVPARSRKSSRQTFFETS